MSRQSDEPKILRENEWVWTVTIGHSMQDVGAVNRSMVGIGRQQTTPKDEKLPTDAGIPRRRFRKYVCRRLE